MLNQRTNEIHAYKEKYGLEKYRGKYIINNYDNRTNFISRKRV